MGYYSNRKCTNNISKDEDNRPVETMSLTIGVFFDGTGNNKYNVNFWEEGEYIPKTDKENYDKYQNVKSPGLYNTVKYSYSSYRDSSRTNVAKLWYLYDTNNMANSCKVYVEGPGTSRPSEKLMKGTSYNDEEGKVSSGEPDITLNGGAFGSGDTGINAKIEACCKMVAKQILHKVKRRNNQNKVELTLVFDVFGFSRGAAAARSFISRIFTDTKRHDVTEGRLVCLQQALSQHDIKCLFSVIHIGVRFVGLFDTVSAYSKRSSINPDFSKNVQELSLKIPPFVRDVVHLVAADEYREHFALTNITSALKRGKGQEIILPGAHSDIGGGYLSVEIEKIMMNGSTYGNRQCRGYKSFKELHEEQWISEIFYKKWETSWKRSGHLAEIVRRIRWDYSKIPLYIMGTDAKQKNILLKNDVFATSTFLSGDSVTSKLQELKNILLKKDLYRLKEGRIEFTGNQAENNLILAVRTDYIHLSARNEMGHEATKDNKRIIFNG